jgi:hypothetical protein
MALGRGSRSAAGAGRQVQRVSAEAFATLPCMGLILLLIVLILVFGGGGYYMGPGVGYYGGGALDIILGLIVVYLLFGRGRRL